MSKFNSNSKQYQNNTIEVPLCLEGDISEDLYGEILSVIAGTKFTKISIPVNTYRKYVVEGFKDDDTRVSTIGYVKKFNPKTNKFVVVIFNNSVDAINKLQNPAMELVFTQYKGKLGTITKFNIIPTDSVVESSTEETATTVVNNTEDDSE